MQDGSKQRWNPASLPYYREIGDRLTLIGVGHSSFRFPGPRKKISEFKGRLLEQDLLVFEGTEEAHRVRQGFLGPLDRTYESIALEHFKGKKAFLDGLVEADYVQMLMEFGVEPLTFGLMRAIPAYERSYRESKGDPEQADQGVRRYFEVGKQLQPELSGLDGELVVRALPGLLFGLDQRFGLHTGIHNRLFIAFEEFLTSARDTEIYAPALGELMGGEGKKAAILGANHIDRIAEILTGGFRQIGWKDFVERMEPDLRSAMQLVEGFVRAELEKQKA